MAATVAAQPGGSMDQALGARYQAGNSLLQGEMSYNKAVYLATVGLAAALAAVMLVGGAAMSVRKDAPVTKVQGRAMNVRVTSSKKSVYNNATKRTDIITTVIHYFDAEYSVGDARYTAKNLARSNDVTEGDTINLEYADANPALAWECCKTSSKTFGVVLIVFGTMVAASAGGMYMFRNNAYIVNRGKTVTAF
jgi:hypothetical protein